MACMLLLLLGLTLSVPAVAHAGTNFAQHSTQPNPAKSMKAYKKQQKKNQKKMEKSQEKAQKKMKQQVGR